MFSLQVSLYVCIPHESLVPTEAEKSIRSLGTAIADGCGPASGCWERNLGFLEEQPVLLNH